MNLNTHFNNVYSKNSTIRFNALDGDITLNALCQYPKEKLIDGTLNSTEIVKDLGFKRIVKNFSPLNKEFSVHVAYRYFLVPHPTTSKTVVGPKFGWRLYQAGATRLNFRKLDSENKITVELKNRQLTFKKAGNVWLLLLNDKGNKEEYPFDRYELEQIESGWQITHPEGESLLFNTFGKLIQRSDGDNLLTYHYGHGGYLTAVIDESGDSLSFEYDAFGKPIAFRPPSSDGRVIKYQYDDFKRLAGIITQNTFNNHKNKKYFYYDDSKRPFLLTRIVNNNKLVFRCEYEHGKFTLFNTQH